MKQFILGLATFICCYMMAQGFEANIKIGYDFFRGSTLLDKNNINTFENYTRGFILGLEVLPLTFQNEKIKLGAGVEYNFGTTDVKYKNEKMHKLTTMIPLYATAKFTYYRPKNIDLNLYTFARLGWVFATERPYNNQNNGNYNYPSQDTSGLYYGLGLGIDYKYFLAEILYDGKYSNNIQPKYSMQATSINIHTPDGFEMSHNFHHKVGVRLGLQLGTQHFKKTQVLNCPDCAICPKCEPKVIEKIVEVPRCVRSISINSIPKVIEKIIEIPRLVEKKVLVRKFDISAEALFAFDKYKLEDIKANGKKIIEEKIKELKASGFEIIGMNVIGHTDRLGTDEYNYKLGLNRANTIAEYLKELGIKVEIKVTSKGNTNPKIYCDNSIKPYSKLKECLQPNRRVEIQFLGLEKQQKVEETI